MASNPVGNPPGWTRHRLPPARSPARPRSPPRGQRSPQWAGIGRLPPARHRPGTRPPPRPLLLPQAGPPQRLLLCV